jgi:hypothetical protein
MREAAASGSSKHVGPGEQWGMRPQGLKPLSLIEAFRHG